MHLPEKGFWQNINLLFNDQTQQIQDVGTQQKQKKKGLFSKLKTFFSNITE